MDVRKESEAAPTKNRTEVERKSERELVVTRTVNAPARLVFEAWTKAELFRRWWVPKSYGLNLLSCEMDVRVGGQYRLVFRHEDSTMEFFGTYLEVTPHSRLVWTNEEGDGGKTVTTVTFDETAGKTLLVVHDLYPSKEAIDCRIDGRDARGARPTRRASRQPGIKSGDKMTQPIHQTNAYGRLTLRATADLVTGSMIHSSETLQLKQRSAVRPRISVTVWSGERISMANSAGGSRAPSGR